MAKNLRGLGIGLLSLHPAGPCPASAEPAVVEGTDVTRIAMRLEGTIAAPHFDRTAFKVRRIYATLASDGSGLNLMLTPDEQAFKVMLAPEIYAPIPNGWGRNGATSVDLGSIGLDELEAALRMAWEHGRAIKPRGR